jgi:hypothetical protein
MYMKQPDSIAKPNKRKGKWGCLIFVILILIGLAILYLPYIGKEKTADNLIESIYPQLKEGMNQYDVTGILEANGFKINTTSPPKGKNKNRQVYLKAVGESTFSWIRYDVLIEYNENGLLKFVRFLKSRHADGQDTSCLIIFEVPTKMDKKYPVACPENVQDF